MPAPKLIRTLPGRAAVLLAAALMLYWAEARTLAGVLGRANPALATRFAPNDSRALETLADQRMTAGLRSRRFGDAADLAKAAILRSPISVVAFRVLGLLADIDRKPDRAEILLRHADSLSRRDLGVRLYLLERAVARNDADGALRHYDIALRTSNSSFDLLAPVLSGAFADRGVLDPIARAFAADPPWLPAFLDYAIPNTPAPRNLAGVMARSRGTSAMRSDATVLRMVDRLVHDGHYRDARRFLTLMRPNERPRAELVRNGRFTGTDNYPPFNWAYTDNLDLGASPQPAEGGLRYYARADQSGPVAKQLLTLTPGPYRLTSVASRLSRDPAGLLQWTLRCAGASSAPLATLEFSQAGTESVRAAAPFRVPAAGCAGQWLELHLRSSEDPAGLEGFVREVDIRPARPSAR